MVTFFNKNFLSICIVFKFSYICDCNCFSGSYLMIASDEAWNSRVAIKCLGPNNPVLLKLHYYIYIIYIISYKLPRVPRPKNTIIWKSIPFLLEDQRYSLLSCTTVFGQSSRMKLLYLHARNAMSLPQRALRESKNYRWSFKRKGEFHLIVFFASIPRQLVTNDIQYMLF